jgi:NAD(P)-dependent dehydrogenase (short-subunit alcohol dehydrogenase family)
MHPSAVARLFDLSGRTALVTGASRGIGRALAEGLAGAGASLWLAARDADGLRETAEAVATAGGEARWAALDVTDTGAAARLLDDTGPVDILVNNAGVEQVRDSLSVDEALWDRIVDTNLKGAFFAAQAAAAAAVADGRALSIVNLCSLTSFVGVPTAVAYTSAKSGLAGMTRALAAEWAGQRIRVNALAPGYFHTAMTDVFYRDPAWREAMLAKIPMRRFGELDDLVGAAVFLAGPASAYMTGQILALDGGYLASI